MNESRTYEELVNMCNQFGYKVFSDKPYDVQIFGERKTHEQGDNNNEFNDTLYVRYFDENGILQFKRWAITTDPGKHWLNHPLNKDGCAIVVPEQYRGVWCIRKHQGKYEALGQKGKIMVYRDDNKDDVLDCDPETIQEGTNYGINCHRSNPYTESYYVDRWSAGCQVFKRIDDFNEMMEIMYKAKKIWGNSFSYTLFTQAELETGVKEYKAAA